MFGSSMPLVAGIGWVHEFLNDGNPPPHVNAKRLVCKEGKPTILEPGHDTRRLEQCACIHLVAGSPPPDPPLSSMLTGWRHSQCGVPKKVGSSSDPQSRSHP